MIPFAHIDGQFARDQLGLLLREWYLHPNGQMPAYEFGFDDVNPPVHAWAAWRVYKIAGHAGNRDRDFLESVFQKLLLNFTWWVNRKDPDGRNLFAGGFLGLDNIGVFDRSKELPAGGTLRQADGTSWMAFYCVTMLAISLELAHDNGKIRTAYEDMASKFLEHFVQIADAMNTLGGTGLWDETDGFYYDQVKIDGRVVPLKSAPSSACCRSSPSKFYPRTKSRVARVLQTLPMVPAIPTGPRQAHLPLRSQRQGRNAASVCSPFPTADGSRG